MSKMEHDSAAAELRFNISTFEKPWYKSTSKLLERNDLRGLSCLDLCCGNCEFSEILRKQFLMDVTCADYIPVHLKRAKDLEFNIITINLDDNSDEVDKIASQFKEKFDIIVCLASIEHIFSTDNLLRFAYMLLKDDGYLVINTPNISFLGYRIYSLFSGNRPYANGHHVRYWDFRFLRTHIFLNGFNVIDDYRRFYSLPTDVIERAFRNRSILAGVFSRLFFLCFLFQYLPFGKSLFADELTVLCRKEDVPPVGFELVHVKKSIEQVKGKPEELKAISRLKEARKRGWLNEHPYLAEFVDSKY